MQFSGSFPKPARIGVGFNPQLCLDLRSMVVEREIYLVNENTYVYQSPFLAITICFLIEIANTVEPLYSGHCWGMEFWPLYRGGCCRGVSGFRHETFK